MQILSGKELIISCETPPDNLDFLAEIEGTITKLIGNKIIISYDPKKVAVAKILGKIAENKISICDISTKQPDLEEIFKHLITAK